LAVDEDCLMATYRALQDISLGASWPYITAGQMLTDGLDGNPANIPLGWVPPAAVDPISSDAIQNFWNAGVQILGMVRVSPPLIYWQPFPAGGGTRPYQLTGPGAALGFVNWITTRGAAP
jgi:hypothetical protein